MTTSPGLRGGPDDALLWIDGLVKSYGGRGRTGAVRAVDEISVDVRRGEVLGVVGESGSGKSTLARCVLRLVQPDSGTIVFDGVDLTRARGAALRRLRRRFQCAFQDPFASLDPRYTVGALVEEPLAIHGIGTATERRAAAGRILDLVGIGEGAAGRRPHTFSGGQRQRIALARALVLEPELVLLDEPVSALDVSVQAQILNLLSDLREELHLTYVLIVHDLLVAEYFCDRIAVVYAGKVMEAAPTTDLFARPSHPYTVSLLAAAPVPDPDRARIQLRSGSAFDNDVQERPSRGCPFRLRCPIGRDREPCADAMPPLSAIDADHWVACHFPAEIPTITPERKVTP